MEEIEFVDSGGYKTLGTLSIPEHARSVVVISHGFSSSKESRLYPLLESELNALGIGTLRYNYYGHGKLYCKDLPYKVTKDVTLSKCLDSLRSAVSYVRRRGNYDIGLVGNSFGGLLSIIVASEDPNIKALALKSPVTDAKELWRKRLGEKRMREWEETGIMHFDECGENFELNYGFWLDLQKYDSLEMAKLINCPTLIVHGTRDSVVPIQQSRALVGRIPKAQLKTVAGADHDYADPTEFLSMKKLIINFLKTRLP
jgi:uncharacterized protein